MIGTPLPDSLSLCASTRRIAAESLFRSLRKLNIDNTRLSEVAVRDAWLAELRMHDTVFPDGWYVPPPHGMGVLFGTATRNSRMNYRSLRDNDTWPKDTVFLRDDNQMGYVYASPVDRNTGSIGDFGMTIYTGKDPGIQDHLRRCLRINRELYDYASVDMPFSSFYRYAIERFATYGLSNNITSTTDPTGVNIGHTIPIVDAQERAMLKEGEKHWSAVCAMISKTRQFVNGVESQRFLPGMAVTLEPRLVDQKNPDIPMSSFHTIMFFHTDGSKELLTDFDDIFMLMNMKYMLP